MNLFVAVILVFAVIGFIDKIFGLKWGLTESFDKGLLTMGTMVIPIVGICGVGVEFIKQHVDFILQAADVLPFDPSLLTGAALATDIGGFLITKELTENYELLILNGVVLSALLGQTISFQFPVFLSVVEKEHHPVIVRGFIIGIIVIPVGLLAAGLLLKMPITLFLKQFVPILLICLLLAGGLVKFPVKVVKGVTVFSKGIQLLIYLLFFLTVVGVFVPSLAYADLSAVYDSLTIVFKSAVIISGSLVLSELILKFFRAKLQFFARKLGINEVSMVALLMNCATSLAILPLFSRMDRKGQMLNAAFAVSGAYILGGQLGFVSIVTDGYAVTIFIVSKLLCGLLSVFVMSKVYSKFR